MNEWEDLLERNILTRIRRIGQWIGKLLGDKEKRQKSNIVALDGVRAIACLTVLDFHINLMTRDTHIWNPANFSHMLISAIALAGASGVTLFFVLSGFLLFMPYAKALVFEGDWPSARQFYLRRVLRIMPGYYFALFAMIFIIHPEYLHPDHWRQLGLFLTFLMDSTPQTFQKLNGPFWTLAIEWQFYMLLPLLALLFGFVVQRIHRSGGSPRRRSWTVALCLLAVIAWGPFSRYWGVYFTSHQSATFLLPRPVLNVVIFFLYGASGKYLEDFAIGMLVSLCYVYAQHRLYGVRLNQLLRRLSPWLWGLGIPLLLFTAVWHLDLWYYHSVPLLDGLVPAFGWLSEVFIASGFGLCVAATLFDNAGLHWFFGLAPLRWLGLISYSLYMWHLPILTFFKTNIGYHIEGWGLPAYGLYLLWALLIVVPFSFLLYVCIEKPFMKLSDRLRKKKTPPPLDRNQQAAPSAQSGQMAERASAHAAP